MRILLLNQCFYPDVVATGQYLAELAVALQREGHAVSVLTGGRGYDDPEIRFRARENWNGIEIIRISSLGLGKKSRLRRASTFISFLLSATWRLFRMQRFDLVVSLTSPPLLPVLAAIYVKVKGGRLTIWVMDLNPDEAIAHGWLRQESLTTRILNGMMSFSFRQADHLIVLDRFMKERIVQKRTDPAKIKIIALWPHEEAVYFSAVERERFRNTHAMNGNFVVMHSGNHGPCHSLDTLLEAAKQLGSNHRIKFYFVGGGSEFHKINQFAEAHALKNVLCLPYQPLNELSASLSAADLQVVIMGDAFLGIKHPCKIYNLLNIGLPILYIGPEQSHITDIAFEVSGSAAIHFARHGDVESVIRYCLKSADSGNVDFSQNKSAIPVENRMDRSLKTMVEVITDRN